MSEVLLLAIGAVLLSLAGGVTVMLMRAWARQRKNPVESNQAALWWMTRFVITLVAMILMGFLAISCVLAGQVLVAGSL